MKKVLSLIMVLAVMLSLVACGGTGGTGDTGDTVATTAEIDSQSQMASEFNYKSYASAIKDNIVTATENYDGKYYKISAFVDEIQNDYCILKVLNDPTKSYEYFWIKVILTKEDLVKIHTNERITVVGNITDITHNGFTLKDAHYVDNIFEFDIKLLCIASEFGSDKLTFCVGHIQDEIDNALCPLAELYFNEGELSLLKEGQTIKIQCTLTAVSTGSGCKKFEYSENLSEYILLDLNDIKII